MTEEAKLAYIDKMNAQIREWTAKVEIVKARVAKGSAEVRIDYHARLERWAEKEVLLKQNLAKLRGVGNDGFDAMKSAIQSAWNDLNQLTISIEENKNEKPKKH